MKPMIKKVIMSKKVAAKYIDSISEVGRTLTVYFSDGRQMRSFVNKIKTASSSSDISICEGFDRVTFLSTDEEAIATVSKHAEELGLDAIDM